jgi:NAD(P)-dependent dehydrogenase (short-subunit alcohol dehydrogenase family)
MPVLLITGGAKRVGLAVINHFAKNGWDVAFTYYKSHSDAESLVKKFKNKVKIISYYADLREEKSANSLIKKVNNDFNKIDLLINNASIFKEQNFYNTTIEDLDNNYALHIKAPFILCQEYMKYHDKGVIINITDAMIYKIASKFFAYNLTKNSLSMLTQMIRKDVSKDFKIYEIAPKKLLNDKNDNKISVRIEQENIRIFIDEICDLLEK